jgi:Tol biopolymer transport system component
VISTQYQEWTTTFTPDGRTVYFSQGVSPAQIIFSKKVNSKWQTPQIAGFSGTWYDTDPFISPDGKRLYFCSNRPVTQVPADGPDKNFHIWMVRLIGNNKWSTPVRLGENINYPGVNTWYPSESENGDFYFHSFGRPGGHGKNDIYVSKHSGNNFTAPSLISIDTAGFNTQECAISKKNDFMFFISNKPGGTGLLDIYITFRKDSLWSKPVNLGKLVNRPGTTAMSPALSPDGSRLYFASNYNPNSALRTRSTNYQMLLKKNEQRI